MEAVTLERVPVVAETWGVVPEALAVASATTFPPASTRSTTPGWLTVPEGLSSQVQSTQKLTR